MVRAQHQQACEWIWRWTLVLVISAAGIFLSSHPVRAQSYVSTTEARAKLSSDLLQALTASSVSGVSWARETAGGRMVKVLVIGSPQVDPDLVDLRRAITQAGGSVYYRYISVTGVAALLPASRVIELARRGDVESVSPNRMTARTKSAIEKSTGASEVRGAGGITPLSFQPAYIDPLGRTWRIGFRKLFS